MRNRLLVAFSIVAVTSGCAGSVIFGHTIGQPKAHDQPPAVAPAPSQPAQATTTVQAPPVQGAAAEPPASPAVTPGKFKAANVAWASAADAKMTADPRFNRDQLLTAVTDALRAHQLLDDGGKADTGRTLAIVIDDFTTRAGSNAVVLGYSFTRATLAGHVEVQSASSDRSERFAVMAESRLASPADGEQLGALKPLYRKFADIIVSRLTGVPLKTTTELPR